MWRKVLVAVDVRGLHLTMQAVQTDGGTDPRHCDRAIARIPENQGNGFSQVVLIEFILSGAKAFQGAGNRPKLPAGYGRFGQDDDEHHDAERESSVDGGSFRGQNR